MPLSHVGYTMNFMSLVYNSELVQGFGYGRNESVENVLHTATLVHILSDFLASAQPSRSLQP